MARVKAPLGLIGLAAMLGSHWLAYLLATPDPHTRADLLEATGHGYLPSAMGLAVAALFLGLGLFVSSRLSPEVRDSRRRIFAHALPRFLMIQVGGFTALELVERLGSGHAVGVQDILASTFLIGVAIQLLAAVLSAAVLVLVATVVDRLTSSGLPTSVGASVSLPLISLIAAPRPVVAAGSRTLRGPPVLA